MNLAGWVRTSTLDYPGRLATVVFTRGCDMDCFFCHNRPLLGPEASPFLDEAAVLDHLKRRSGVLDGLVLSGGEPTLQPDLIPFIRRARALGYAVKLDTNGGHPEVLRALLLSEDLPLIDYVAMDYKAPWNRYSDICGCAADLVGKVQQSLDLLRVYSAQHASGLFSWELRTTVIPQLSEEDLTEMAQAVPALPHYALQLYRPPEEYRPEDRFRIHVDAMTPGMLNEAAERIQSIQPNIQVRA